MILRDFFQNVKDQMFDKAAALAAGPPDERAVLNKRLVSTFEGKVLIGGNGTRQNTGCYVDFDPDEPIVRAERQRIFGRLDVLYMREHHDEMRRSYD